MKERLASSEMKEESPQKRRMMKVHIIREPLGLSSLKERAAAAVEE